MSFYDSFLINQAERTKEIHIIAEGRVADVIELTKLNYPEYLTFLGGYNDRQALLEKARKDAENNSKNKTKTKK